MARFGITTFGSVRRVHHGVLRDDAVQREQIRRDRVHLVGRQRLRRHVRHRAADVVEHRRRVRPVAADRAHRRRLAQRALPADELIVRPPRAVDAVAREALRLVDRLAGRRGARARRQARAVRADADRPSPRPAPAWPARRAPGLPAPPRTRAMRAERSRERDRDAYA